MLERQFTVQRMPLGTQIAIYLTNLSVKVLCNLQKMLNLMFAVSACPSEL